MPGAVTSNRPGPVRPALGIRGRPGRLALAVFRLPLLLYRRGWGKFLGRDFLLLVHAGGKTGALHSSVAMILRLDPASGEAVICSAWGQDTDWIRNIRAHPAVRVQIGRESFTPEQRFLPDAESQAVLAQFRRRHPVRSRLIAWVLGCGDLGSADVARAFVSTRPFVAFRPPARSGAGKENHGLRDDGAGRRALR